MQWSTDIQFRHCTNRENEPCTREGTRCYINQLSKLKFFMKKILFLLLISLSGLTFAQSFVNPHHLDHLYEERQFSGKTIGFVYIYAEAPDYKYVEAVREGISCVDDVARAAVFYRLEYLKHQDKKTFNKIAALSRFLLYVQNQNGFYNNFIFADGSVNTVFRTSVAEPNWWSWRAVWALATVYDVIREKDTSLAGEMKLSMQRLISVATPPFLGERADTSIHGFMIPKWLPAEGGADQAAVMVKALAKYFQLFQDSTVLPTLSALCDGILAMQVKDSTSEVYGVFLSWQNTWHGWGNNQSDALLDAYAVTKDERYRSAALLEISHFYPWLQKTGYLLGFVAKNEAGKVTVLNKEKYSQIAYDIRPMVFACLNAVNATGEKKYFDQALTYAGWFFGDNPLKQTMYSVKTGRCYDGISSEAVVNLNSGAESTIEALLSLSLIETFPGGYQALHKKYDKK